METSGRSRSSGQKRPRPRRDRRKKRSRFDWSEKAPIGVQKEPQPQRTEPLELHGSTTHVPSKTSKVRDEIVLNDAPIDSNILHANIRTGLAWNLNEINDDYLAPTPVERGENLNAMQDIGSDTDCVSVRYQANELDSSEDNHHFSITTNEQADNDSDDEDASEETEKIHSLDRKSPNTWQKLLAVIAISGTNRFTREQYEFFRNTVNWLLGRYAPGEEKIPSYSMVQRTLLPYLWDKSFPGFEKHVVPVDMKKAGAKVSSSGHAASSFSDPSGTVRSHVSQPKAEIQIILPSTWAVKDVSFKPTWDLLQAGCREELSNHSCNTVFPTVSSAPIVLDRQLFLDGGHHSIFCRNDRTKVCNNFHRSGDTVHIVLNAIPTPRRGATMDSNEFNSFLRSLSVTRKTNSEFLLTAVIGKTHLVCTDENGRNTIASNQNPDVQRTSSTEKFKLWRSGDICTNVSVSSSTSYRCVLVHRFGGFFDTGNRVELVWVPLRIASCGVSVLEYEQARKQVVKDLIYMPCVQRSALHGITSTDGSASLVEDVPLHPNRENGDLEETNVPDSFHCGCKYSEGVLMKDGQRYFVYRVLLYSDGFSQYKDVQGSAGGVYMLPLSLLPEHRTSRKAVRLLGLTPPGVSTSQVLCLVAEDLQKAATNGIKTIDGDGRSVIVFIQVVAYVGDFLEIAHISDLLGHNEDAACHLCVFRKQKLDPYHSCHGHTTALNSTDSSSFRSGPRTAAIRDEVCRIEEKNRQMKHLGMEPLSAPKVINSPLFLLHQRFKEVASNRQIPLASCGHHLFDPSFDPYRSVLVAPDHLLAGNAINILTTCFLLLPSKGDILDIELKICDALRSNSLITQNKIFDFKSNKLFSTSISGTFSILFVAAQIFQDRWHQSSVDFRSSQCATGVDSSPDTVLQKAVTALRMFMVLVSKTYWYPKLHVDGLVALELFNSGKGFDFINSQQALSRDYVDICDKLCGASEVAKRKLDKPNLHRIIELYVHSIPAMGHVRHFSELVFEFAHQPLKRGIARSNRQNPHIQAVKHALADDWQDRLSAFALQKRLLSAEEFKLSMRQFIRGGGHSPIEERELGTGAHCTQGSSRDVLIEPILKKLLGSNQPNDDTKATNKWNLSLRQPISDEQEKYRSLVNSSVLNQYEEREVFFFENAKRFKKSMNMATASLRSVFHCNCRRGDAVQVTIHRRRTNEVLLNQPTTSEINQSPEDYYVAIFAIEALLQWKDTSSTGLEAQSGPFAVVRRCTRYRGDTLTVADDALPLLLQLNESVRRVGLIHACSRSTRPEPCLFNRILKHNDSLLTGGRFYYFTKQMGYPPRMG